MSIKYRSRSTRDTGLTHGRWYRVIRSSNGMYRVLDDDGIESLIYQDEIESVDICLTN